MNQTSPVVTEKVNKIDFYSAIKELAAGKKITKLEWQDENVYCLLKEGVITLHKEDNKFYQWIINDGDLTGTDWIVL